MLLTALIILLSIILITTYISYHPKDGNDIVVAKYKEDISWASGKNVSVLDKTNGTIRNIGRESHTYLTYIIENYENLPEIMFFTQGGLDTFGDPPVPIDPDGYLRLKDGETYSGNWVQHNDHCDTWYKEPGRKRLCIPTEPCEWGGTLDPAPEDFPTWFTNNIKSEIPAPFKWYMHGWFSIRREKITSRPREFYVNLINQFPDHSAPELGHYFERSWFYIFNLDI
jgi:Protein of unknown function (DUF3431)